MFALSLYLRRAADPGSQVGNWKINWKRAPTNKGFLQG
jgi:hypothetical protein